MTQLYGNQQGAVQVYGDGRPGLTFAEIRVQTAAGAHGPGLVFNDWDGAADAAAEIVIQVMQAPASGSLHVRRNGSASLTGAADGVWPFQYRLRVNGVATQAVTSYFVVGEAALAVGDLSLAGATMSGSAGAVVGIQRYGAAFFTNKQLYGAAKDGWAETSGALTLAPAAVSGSASVSPVASGGLALTAATLAGAASVGAGAAGSLTLDPATMAGNASIAGTPPVAEGALPLAPAIFSGTASVAVGPVVPRAYPDPATVLAGVRYGPTGVEFTGTLELCATPVRVAEAVRAELAEELRRVVDLAKIHGLISGAPLSVGPLSRVAGDIVQSISTANGTTTVSRAE